MPDSNMYVCIFVCACVHVISTKTDRWSVFIKQFDPYNQGLFKPVTNLAAADLVTTAKWKS